MKILDTVDYQWQAGYMVIDNFLSEEHLKGCIDIFDRMPRDYDWNCCENFIPREGKIEVQDHFVLDLYNTYNPILLEMLQGFAPEKEKYITGSQIDFVNTTPGKEWDIHHDLEDKLLSVVVYIGPKKNTGTILYSSEEGDNPHEIEWKVNRCLAFSRTDDTWHNYKNVHEEDRLTLIYNLVSYL